MDTAGSGTTGWHTSTSCFGFEYLDADSGANAALNHTEDLSMNELAGTARVPRDRTQHHRWRGPLSDSRGLPWACRRRLDAAKKLLTDMRGEMKQFYMVMGDFDFVGICEAPDDAVMARYVLQLGGLGFVRTKTLKAFPETAYREIIRSLG
jgi:uncharacterized protein with GYD domain